MTKKEIDKLVKDIKKVTEEVCKSQESAQKFLIDAGIIIKEKYEKEVRHALVKLMQNDKQRVQNQKDEAIT